MGGERRESIVSNRRIVRAKTKDKLDLNLHHLCPRYRFRLPENVTCDGEGSPLFLREISCDELACGAAEVIDAICKVLADIDFAVRICYSVHHALHELPHNNLVETAQRGFAVAITQLVTVTTT